MHRSISKACNLLNTRFDFLSVNCGSLKKLCAFSQNANFSEKRANNYEDKQSIARFCVDTVRKYDFENYLATALINDSFIRRTAFAVRALNVELSQIRDLTTNETSAQMRFQFWLRLITDIFDGIDVPAASSGSQPVASEIQKCFLASQKTLSKRWFLCLIESRMSSLNLSNFPFTTIKDLEVYIDSSVSPVFYIINEAARSVGTADRKTWSNIHLKLDHIGNHVSKAQGFCNILRGINHNAVRGRCYIPSELLITHKVSVEQILRKSETKPMKDVCFELACSAEQHIRKAKSLIEGKDIQHWKSIFLPIIPIERFLIRLQRADFNIFNERLHIREGGLPFRLWIYSKLIKYNLK